MTNKKITIAVAGNPNCGKSTLINAIAGSKLNVGNWPGVTVEKKTAKLTHKNNLLNFVDLPGTYSLNSYSEDERVACNYLLTEKPDILVNVLDSTNLERNLFLTIQLLELNIPTILVLNFSDEAEKKGLTVNNKALEELLGVKTINTVASKKTGVKLLLDELIKKQKQPSKISYSEDIEDAIKDLKLPNRFSSLKTLEGNFEFPGGSKFKAIDTKKALHHLSTYHDEDFETILTEERHGICSGIANQVIKKENKTKWDMSKSLDKILLNKYLAFPIFLAIMWLMFKLTFDIATPFIDWIDTVFASVLSKWVGFSLNLINTPTWFVSLVTDGIISGVGFVLVFVPVIFAMMFFITFLEASGYMARAAFITDRLMRTMGLHGKSFVPMLIGFGCNVPAIYATRTLESKKDRILTCLLIPFMSCGARLPVYILFVSAFFPTNSATIVWLLYVSGMIIAAIVGFLLQKTLFKQEPSMFIMELPPYRLPTFKNLMIHSWEKAKHFIMKAGTYILAVAIVVWFLLNVPYGVEDKKDSYLGQAGQIVAPIFKPLGFGTWEAASALVTGVIAKEVIVSTMGEIYANQTDVAENNHSFKQDVKFVGSSFISASKQVISNLVSTFGISSLSVDKDSFDRGLVKVIKGKFTPLTAFVFMFFTLLYMPCVVTGIAMKQELGTWKWFNISMLLSFSIAWTLSFIIYRLGLLFM